MSKDKTVRSIPYTPPPRRVPEDPFDQSGDADASINHQRVIDDRATNRFKSLWKSALNDDRKSRGSDLANGS